MAEDPLALERRGSAWLLPEHRDSRICSKSPAALPKLTNHVPLRHYVA